MRELDRQTRVVLGDYLHRSLQIADLRRSLARLAWALDSQEVTDANQITAAASLFVAEYEAGHRDEDDLRKLFAGLLGAPITEATTETIGVSFPTVRQPGRSRPLAVAGSRLTAVTLPKLEQHPTQACSDRRAGSRISMVVIHRWGVANWKSERIQGVINIGVSVGVVGTVLVAIILLHLLDWLFTRRERRLSS